MFFIKGTDCWHLWYYVEQKKVNLFDVDDQKIKEEKVGREGLSYLKGYQKSFLKGN